MYRILVLFASWLFTVRSSYYAKRIDVNPFDIPIVINNRNRYTYLKMLIDYLNKNGYKNIIILDNNSTYPPLLEYYKILNCEVIFLKKNLGYLALEKIDLYKKIRKSFFVYTDSDVVPIDQCPQDFMSVFLNKLKENKKIQKIGFSLKIDDLPDHYDLKQKVTDWEKSFYERKIDDFLYDAQVDTTFALHKPYAMVSTRGIFKMARSAYPFEARHMPWYTNSKNIGEEEEYYINSVEIGTHWSKGIKNNEKNRLIRWFSYIIKRSNS